MKINLWGTIFRYAFLFVAMFGIISFSAVAKRQKPLIWDVKELEKIKNNGPLDQQYQIIINEANTYIERGIVVVTEKNKTFAPDAHYYCSIGLYWWPDEEHPDQYVRRDGITNPETMQFDGVRLSELSQRCYYLSRAFYLTREKKYYSAYKKQIKAWFLDKETYMYPNFEYAQVIPGQNENKGRATGLIDAYAFNDVIESFRLIDSIKRIGRRTELSIRNWFFSFAEWAQGDYGIQLSEQNNNISLAYDVCIVNMYLFSGRIDKAQLIADSFAEKRLYKQIREDGSQPEELKRTKAFSYSLANLGQIIDFCYIVRYWDKTFYSKNCERINQAFLFLQQYAEQPTSFPYQQITSWDSCILSFYELLNRKEGLE